MIEEAGNGMWCDMEEVSAFSTHVFVILCPERSTFLTTWTGSGTRVNVAHLVTECLERGFESRREFVQVVAET